jgi:hypothetical protein
VISDLHFNKPVTLGRTNTLSFQVIPAPARFARFSQLKNYNQNYNAGLRMWFSQWPQKGLQKFAAEMI